jgi:16S rRNA (guanine966-N2)-methyltransferase
MPAVYSPLREQPRARRRTRGRAPRRSIVTGLRILGGALRGRRLQGEALPGLRPTSSRVREALFDVLGARVTGCAFLDLYAGTGAVGIEALSRGAARAVFVESNRRAARALAANLQSLAQTGPGEILDMDARLALRRLGDRGERFGVIYLDPPWDGDDVGDVLEAAAGIVAPGGVLVVEHRTGRPPSLPGAGTLTPGRVYRHGDASLSLFLAGAASPG